MILFCAAAALAAPAAAHDAHRAPAKAPAAEAAPAEAAPGAPAPFPVAIAPRFALIDGAGARRTEADFAGRVWLLSFGYARCRAMCPATAALLAETLATLRARGAAPPVVFVSVDPEDTPAALAAALEKWGGGMIGLTGDAQALAAARASVQIGAEKVSTQQDGAPIFAHASYIYVVGADGTVAALLPPVFGPERLAAIIAGHL